MTEAPPFPPSLRAQVFHTSHDDLHESLLEKRKYVGAGMIIIRTDTADPQVLCILGTPSQRWGFPKGKAETYDEGIPVFTAARETYEETGLFAGTDYVVMSAPITHAQHLYCIARITEAGLAKGITLSPREHCDHRWFPIKDLTELTMVNSGLKVWAKKMAKAPYYHNTLSELSSYITSTAS